MSVNPVRVDIAEIVRALDGLAVHAPEATRRSVQLDIENMIAHCVRNEISGQRLGVVTGTARRSMAGLDAGSKTPPGAAAIKAAAQARTIERVSVVRGEWGSPLRYVQAHEEGASGAAWVPSHARRTPSGGTTTVRAHARAVNIRAKRFIRATMESQGFKVPIRAKRALLLLAMTGRVPEYSNLQGVR